MAAPVGSAVTKAVGGALQHFVRDRIAMREDCDDSAHSKFSLLECVEIQMAADTLESRVSFRT
jgi:hypothetical protein